MLTEHLLPGRWGECRAPHAKELAATSVLRVPLDEWSVKVGDGFPDDPEEDLDEPVWAGVLPMRVAYDDPVDAPDLGPGRSVPPHVRTLGGGGLSHTLGTQNVGWTTARRRRRCRELPNSPGLGISADPATVR